MAKVQYSGVRESRTGRVKHLGMTGKEKEERQTGVQSSGTGKTLTSRKRVACM